MRDPLAPIPSPFGLTAQAETFWEQSQSIPPPLPATPGVVRDAVTDPRRCLTSGEDELGIDRRSRRRHDASGIPASTTAPVTAAQHVELSHLVGLRTRHGWALTHALALSPSGVLLRHFDLLDRDLSPGQRFNARQALLRLSTVISGPGIDSSPLGLVCGCVLSKRVVADLSNWANPGTGSGRIRRKPVSVSIIVPNPPIRLEDAPVRTIARGGVTISGELVPLTDPSPEVIGVSLSPSARAVLAEALGLPTDGGS